MAECQNDNGRLFGGAVVLEVADGCPDTIPAESDWKALAAGTTKGFDYNLNTVSSDADDTAGFVEQIVTNAEFSISFDGEVRKKDRLDQYGIGRFIEYANTEIKAKRQPTLWVRLDYGVVTFVGYMVITTLNSSGSTNDIVTFSTSFGVAAAETIDVINNNTVPSVPVTGVAVTPTSQTVAVGATANFQVNVAPENASNKAFSVTSANDAVVTATKSGTTVTVTGASEGTENVTVTTSDGGFTASCSVIVTA